MRAPRRLEGTKKIGKQCAQEILKGANDGSKLGKVRENKRRITLEGIRNQRSEWESIKKCVNVGLEGGIVQKKVSLKLCFLRFPVWKRSCLLYCESVKYSYLTFHLWGSLSSLFIIFTITSVSLVVVKVIHVLCRGASVLGVYLLIYSLINFIPEILVFPGISLSLCRDKIETAQRFVYLGSQGVICLSPFFFLFLQMHFIFAYMLAGASLLFSHPLVSERWDGGLNFNHAAISQ